MYDVQQVENEIRDFYENNKVYERVKSHKRRGEPFYFCDGPPYVTGELHPGTAWNKIIKDAFCRFYRGKGFNVRVHPGFDTHGLPIEVKVEKEAKITKKAEIEKRGLEKFINACREFATKYIEVMTKQFRHVGVWMDWDEPYITYKDEYIENCWGTILFAYQKGLLYEGLYVLPYCYRCETTIANYELEYGEESDPSMFVKFKLIEKNGREDEKNKEKNNEYLIIWTTTPWTLVGNMAVMAHPTFRYVKVKVDDEIWILAKDRLDVVLGKARKSGSVLEEFSGKQLEKRQYEHPLKEKIQKYVRRVVVLSDEFVSLEEGTGLVHSAPGHGPEDFIIGKRYNIEPFCPVNEHGEFTEEGGVYKEMNVREANIKIIEDLRKKGLLVHDERIVHRYPHCWRCKTPLIFITTKQWFISVSKLKEIMKKEVESVKWVPEFARTRFLEFLREAPDWCISRQRYWGVPLPIWRCSSCRKIKVIGMRTELQHQKELHRPYVDEIKFTCVCGGTMIRIPDVLDVWFDSGNAVWASLKKEEEYRKADLIVEGQDQIRGWFYSLLGSGIVRYDETPYKCVVMHGFFVDEKGEKMSKSLGNFIPLEKILSTYGADSFRFWCLENKVWDDLKINFDGMKEARATLDILYNLVMYLERFHPKKKIKPDKLNLEDSWLMSRLNNTLKTYNEAFRSNEIHLATNAVKRFLVEDTSKFYMKLAKKRVQEGDCVALSLLYESTLETLMMLSPISPFISEHLYQRFFRSFEEKESISMFDIPEHSQTNIDNELEREVEIIKEIVVAGLDARQQAEIKLRTPIKCSYITTKSAEVEKAVNRLSHMIKQLLNVKQVELSQQEKEGGVKKSGFSLGTVAIETVVDEDLYEESILNEIRRIIQSMRKESGLVERDFVSVDISAEKEIEAILKKKEDALRKFVNAKSLNFGEKDGKEFSVDGKRVMITIKKEK